MEFDSTDALRMDSLLERPRSHPYRTKARAYPSAGRLRKLLRSPPTWFQLGTPPFRSTMPKIIKTASLRLEEINTFFLSGKSSPSFRFH
jgi:hypothetical protein